MTVEEVFSKVSAHMIKGLMIHEQMANYYAFLGLNGYSACHEHHYVEESNAYRKLCKYFIQIHNKLVPYSDVDNPSLIPDSWYNHLRQDVDMATKRNAVKNGLSTWIDWEKETKSMYEEMYKNLIEMREIEDANFLLCLIKDVSEELKTAEQYLLNKEAINYDMVEIVHEQKSMHRHYEKMGNVC